MSFLQALAHEWKLLRGQGALLVALAAVALLLVAASINGRALVDARDGTARSLADETSQTLAALRAQAERFERGEAKDRPTAADPGTVGFSVLTHNAVLPPAPLAALAVGQADLLPSWYGVTARGAHTFLGGAELDNPLRLAVGSFDAAFVIVWLLPLLVIALSFDLLSRERESGVLALAVSHGVTVAGYIGRKCIARAVLLLGLVLAAGVLGLAVAGVPLGRPDVLGLVALWLLATVLYGAFWFALALLVNSRPRASDVNAAWLAGLWLAFTVVAPALTNLAATTLFPAPSRVVLTTELREATEAADQAAAREREKYFFDHPEMAGGGPIDSRAFYTTVARTEAAVSEAMRPLLASFDAQALRQQSIVDGLQFLSPGTATWQVLTALAGSDGSRHREFRAQAVEFNAAVNRFFVERLETGATLGHADYAAMPRFVFRDSGTAAVVRRAVPGMAALALAALVLSLLAAARLRRYPVN